MFKKMLKGILAVGAALAIAIPAQAEVSTGGMITADFIMLDDGTTDIYHYSQINASLKGEKTSADVSMYIDDGDNIGTASNDVQAWMYGVNWMVSDTMTVRIGRQIIGASMGYASSGRASLSAPYNDVGNWAGIPAYVFIAEGAHLNMKLGSSMTVYAGILTGTQMTPYAYVEGSAGDIGWAAGAKLNKDNTGMVVTAKMPIGAMNIAFDYLMDKTNNAMDISLNGLELGPGSLGVLYGSNSFKNSTINVRYGWSIEPGTSFDVLYFTQGASGAMKSGMGVTLAKFF